LSYSVVFIVFLRRRDELIPGVVLLIVPPPELTFPMDYPARKNFRNEAGR
jgi:hypothetical protein